MTNGQLIEGELLIAANCPEARAWHLRMAGRRVSGEKIPGFLLRSVTSLSYHITLGIKTAQKPYIVWSLGPKALMHESLDSWGYGGPIVNSKVSLLW